MDEKTKEFFVTKINKYNEMVDKSKTDQILSTFYVGFAGLGIGVSLIGFNLTIIRDVAFLKIPDYLEYLQYFGGLLVNSGLLALSIRSLFQSVTEQAGLEKSIRDIEEKLELDDYLKEVLLDPKSKNKRN